MQTSRVCGWCQDYILFHGYPVPSKSVKQSEIGNGRFIDLKMKDTQNKSLYFTYDMFFRQETDLLLYVPTLYGPFKSFSEVDKRFTYGLHDLVSHNSIPNKEMAKMNVEDVFDDSLFLSRFRSKPYETLCGWYVAFLH